LAGKTYSRDIFRIKGFPLQRLQIEELFIVIVLFCDFQHVTLSTFSLISLFHLQHIYQMHDIAYYVCAESAVKPQSINQSFFVLSPCFFGGAALWLEGVSASKLFLSCARLVVRCE